MVVFVRAVATHRRSLLLERRQHAVEAAQFESVIHLLEPGHRVGTQILVANLLEPARGQRAPIPFESRIHLVERCEHVAFEGLARVDLQRLRVVQRAPESHRRRKHDEWIPHHVQKPRLRKHLREHADAGRVGRALEHRPPRIAHGQRCEKPPQVSLPAVKLGRRQRGEVEGLGPIGARHRKRHAPIGRGRSHVGKGKLVFLWPVPACRDVVHRPLGGHDPAEGARHELLGEQKVAGREALVGRRAAEAVVEHQQFVEHRRARSPVADDEQRRIGGRRVRQLPAEASGRERLGQGVEGSRRGDRAHESPARGRRAAAMLPDEIEPHAKRHPMPKPRAPPRIGVKRFLCGLRCGGGG